MDDLLKPGAGGAQGRIYLARLCVTAAGRIYERNAEIACTGFEGSEPTQPRERELLPGPDPRTESATHFVIMDERTLN